MTTATLTRPNELTKTSAKQADTVKDALRKLREDLQKGKIGLSTAQVQLTTLRTDISTLSSEIVNLEYRARKNRNERRAGYLLGASICCNEALEETRNVPDKRFPVVIQLAEKRLNEVKQRLRWADGEEVP